VNYLRPAWSLQLHRQATRLVSGSDSECQVVSAVHVKDCDSASRTGSLGLPGGRRRLGLGLPRAGNKRGGPDRRSGKWNERISSRRLKSCAPEINRQVLELLQRLCP
jgi:hypothetical protein